MSRFGYLVLVGTWRCAPSELALLGCAGVSVTIFYKAFAVLCAYLILNKASHKCMYGLYIKSLGIGYNI